MTEETSTTEKSTIIGPLNFAPQQTQARINRKSVTVPCLFCAQIFQFENDKDEYLGHLFLSHKFVIADVQQVAILDEYLLFWHEKFQGKLPT